MLIQNIMLTLDENEYVKITDVGNNLSNIPTNSSLSIMSQFCELII